MNTRSSGATTDKAMIAAGLVAIPSGTRVRPATSVGGPTLQPSEHVLPSWTWKPRFHIDGLAACQPEATAPAVYRRLAACVQCGWNGRALRRVQVKRAGVGSTVGEVKSAFVAKGETRYFASRRTTGPEMLQALPFASVPLKFDCAVWADADTLHHRV